MCTSSGGGRSREGKVNVSSSSQVNGDDTGTGVSFSLAPNTSCCIPDNTWSVWCHGKLPVLPRALPLPYRNNVRCMCNDTQKSIITYLWWEHHHPAGYMHDNTQNCTGERQDGQPLINVSHFHYHIETLPDAQQYSAVYESAAGPSNPPLHPFPPSLTTTAPPAFIVPGYLHRRYVAFIRTPDMHNYGWYISPPFLCTVRFYSELSSPLPLVGRRAGSDYVGWLYYRVIYRFAVP